MKNADYVNFPPRKPQKQLPPMLYWALVFPSMLALLIGIIIGRFIIPVKAAEPVIAPAPVVTYQAKELSAPVQSAPVSLGMFTVYGYCPCQRCCGKATDNPAYGITKTGTAAQEGQTVAVDADIIPLGSTVIIDGKEFVAEDTGKGIRGRTIDLFFESHGDAVTFGRQEREVFTVK